MLLGRRKKSHFDFKPAVSYKPKERALKMAV
jgi:hypothetical protein